MLGELVWAVLERALESELTAHLGYERDGTGGNARNGTIAKTVQTGVGPVPLQVPRDRAGTFEPVLVPKRAWRVAGGLDDMVISPYAHGMPVRDIIHHLRQACGTELSPETVSRITGQVLEEVKAWQSRPLDPAYAVVFLDAIVVKARDSQVVQNKPAYTAIGAGAEGEKHVLRIWLSRTPPGSAAEGEGARFWGSVMADLRNRGVRDILIACVDVDEDLVCGAAAHLKAAGVANATVVLGDGAVGLPGQAPFDRVQFTVGSADVPPAILSQVGSGGRLVIPMRVRGSISRSFAFERDGDGPAWTAISHKMATFVPLRKSAADDARARIPVAGDGTVTVEGWEEQDIDRDALATVLDAPGATQWTEVKFRKGDPWEWAYLWLATVMPGGISRMPGKRPGYTPNFSWGSMAALDGATLAYLTVREGDDDAGRYWEIGTTGHGPRAADLARDMADAVREWNRDYGNQAPAPGARLIPAAHRDLLKAADPRFVIDKPASRLVTDWRR